MAQRELFNLEWSKFFLIRETSNLRWTLSFLVRYLNTNSAVWTQFPKLANSPFNGIVSVSLSNSVCKDGNVRFTTVPLKLCLVKYELYFHVFISLNCYFHCGFTAKITFIVRKNKWRNCQSKNFYSQKNDGIFHIFIISRFQGYRCKSGIVISWRVTWHYAYSPFNLQSI